MGCAPSKGSTIAVQPAVTPRAGPATRQANPPPVTPPLTVSNNRNKSNNPLDEKRPLPAIGGLSSEASGRRPSSLTTVPEHEEGSLSQRLPKLDVNAMAKDARESEGSKDVKHTQSSVAFTFDFGDSSAEIKPAGRLPPLIREKTIRKSTEAGELKSTLERRQQEADDRRQNELNSIASKKKRRKVKLKSAKVNNFSSQQSVDSATDVVPPLEISTSPDKVTQKFYADPVNNIMCLKKLMYLKIFFII
ncbi:uncharacterized protein LOC142350559 [Convolutriloba macropyga]|uniref:uncharacterized protein LOC142350559 n=1 Tax=Convolutriloba macropyga TaxID=536237 RepID=UPI003F51B8DD